MFEQIKGFLSKEVTVFNQGVPYWLIGLVSIFAVWGAMRWRKKQDLKEKRRRAAAKARRAKKKKRRRR